MVEPDLFDGIGFAVLKNKIVNKFQFPAGFVAHYDDAFFIGLRDFDGFRVEC